MGSAHPGDKSGRNITIRYTQHGTQAPVYVATSLSSPPWEPLEMQVEPERTVTGDLRFFRDFEEVLPGAYQYKIRLGPDCWVLDDAVETATDNAGNRNNVLVVESPTAESSEPPASIGEASAALLSEESKEAGRVDSIPATQLVESVSIPLAKIEKVGDQDQPASTVNPVLQSFRESPLKASGDPEQEENSVDQNRDLPTASIPSVTVGASESQPTMGDSFGSEPIQTRKNAQEQLTRDGESNQTLVSSRGDGLDEMERDLEKRLDFSSLKRGLGWAGLNEHGTLDSPRQEHAPLFAHERVFAAEAEDQHNRPQSSSHVNLPSTMRDEVEIAEDFEDPAIEPFPSDRQHIFEQILTTENRLVKDETKVYGTPPSPLRASLSPTTFSSSASCSSEEAGTSLQSIKEEDIMDGTLQGLPPPAEQLPLSSPDVDRPAVPQTVQRANESKTAELTSLSKVGPGTSAPEKRDTGSDAHVETQSKRAQSHQVASGQTGGERVSAWRLSTDKIGDYRRQICVALTATVAAALAIYLFMIPASPPG